MLRSKDQIRAWAKEVLFLMTLTLFFVNFYLIVILFFFLGMSKSFIYEPQPLTTYEGGQARFSCQINAVPAATVSWYKDGIELPQNDSRFVFLFFLPFSSSLLLFSKEIPTFFTK